MSAHALRSSMLASLLGVSAVVLVGALAAAGAGGRSGGFVEYQSIPTHGCHDVAFFTIDGAHFLAATAFFDDASHALDSKIYRWDGDSFEEYQSIPTKGLVDWEYFEIDAVPFLALANHRDGTIYDVDSFVYRWDGARFVEFQGFQSHQAQDWEFFSIGSAHFLVLNSNLSIRPSMLYQWNGTRFEPFQPPAFDTAVYDWEFFALDGESFLAAALGRDRATTFDVDSKILRWDGTRFAEFQSISTHGAHDWQSFSIGSAHFLAVANERGGDMGGPRSNVDSAIYRWDGSRFTPFLALPTRGARGVRFFTLDADDYYLAFANRFDAVRNSLGTDSTIYRWDGYRHTFREFQSIPTQGAEDWDFTMIDGIPYIAVANQRSDVTHNVGSKIYRWKGLPRFEAVLPFLESGWPEPDAAR